MVLTADPVTPSVDEHGAKSVLGRISLVLDAFDEVHDELTLSELTERCELPKSTVHRLAEQLVGLGWLERGPRGYRVGMRLFEIGGLARRRARMRDNAMPFMQELAAATHCAVHLGILDGFEVVYLATVPARGLELPTREGGRMPASCTGLGKAMLAFSDDHVIELAISRGCEHHGFAPLPPDALRAELATIARVGVAFDREEGHPGVACAAAPIRGSGRAIAAISVTGRAADFEFERASRLARHAAAGIWSELVRRRAF